MSISKVGVLLDSEKEFIIDAAIDTYSAYENIYLNGPVIYLIDNKGKVRNIPSDYSIYNIWSMTDKFMLRRIPEIEYNINDFGCSHTIRIHNMDIKYMPELINFYIDDSKLNIQEFMNIVKISCTPLVSTTRKEYRLTDDNIVVTINDIFTTIDLYDKNIEL